MKDEKKNPLLEFLLNPKKFGTIGIIFLAVAFVDYDIQQPKYGFDIQDLRYLSSIGKLAVIIVSLVLIHAFTLFPALMIIGKRKQKKARR